MFQELWAPGFESPGLSPRDRKIFCVLSVDKSNQAFLLLTGSSRGLGEVEEFGVNSLFAILVSWKLEVMEFIFGLLKGISFCALGLFFLSLGGE